MALGIDILALGIWLGTLVAAFLAAAATFYVTQSVAWTLAAGLATAVAVPVSILVIGVAQWISDGSC